MWWGRGGGFDGPDHLAASGLQAGSRRRPQLFMAFRLTVVKDGVGPLPIEVFFFNENL